MTGNYTIECPNPKCQHHHYRYVSEGLATEDRHNKKYGESEIIVGLLSTLQDTPWHNDPSYLRSQIRAIFGGASAK